MKHIQYVRCAFSHTQTRATTAHLSLDIAHALIVQFRCRAHFKDEPRTEVIIEIEENGKRQQEQADKYPPLVNHHVFETFDSDPQEEDKDQTKGVEQRLHDFRTGQVRFRAANQLKAGPLLLSWTRNYLSIFQPHTLILRHLFTPIS